MRNTLLLFGVLLSLTVGCAAGVSDDYETGEQGAGATLSLVGPDGTMLEVIANHVSSNAIEVEVGADVHRLSFHPEDNEIRVATAAGVFIAGTRFTEAAQIEIFESSRPVPSTTQAEAAALLLFHSGLIQSVFRIDVSPELENLLRSGGIAESAAIAAEDFKRGGWVPTIESKTGRALSKYGSRGAGGDTCLSECVNGARDRHTLCHCYRQCGYGRCETVW